MHCYGWSILALWGAIPAARRAALFSIAIYFARFRARDREIAISRDLRVLPRCPGLGDSQVFRCAFQNYAYIARALLPVVVVVAVVLLLLLLLLWHLVGAHVVGLLAT